MSFGTLPGAMGSHGVSETFKDLYFSDEENDLIDSIRANIKHITDPYKKAIAMSALIRARLKKGHGGSLRMLAIAMTMGVEICR